MSKPILSEILNVAIHVDDLCLIEEALGVYSNYLKSLGVIGIVNRTPELAQSINDVKRLRVQTTDRICEYVEAQSLLAEEDNEE